MVLPNDDVGVIPGSVAALTHIPQPPAMRSVGLRLRYIGDAKLVRGWDDLQRRGLLARSQVQLPDGQVDRGAGCDFGVATVLGRSAEVLVLLKACTRGAGPAACRNAPGVPSSRFRATAMRTNESITVGDSFGRLLGRKPMVPITPANMARTSMMGCKYRRLEDQSQLPVFQRLAGRITISLRQLRDDEVFPPPFPFLGCLSSSRCARGVEGKSRKGK